MIGLGVISTHALADPVTLLSSLPTRSTITAIPGLMPTIVGYTCNHHFFQLINVKSTTPVACLIASSMGQVHPLTSPLLRSANNHVR